MGFCHFAFCCYCCLDGCWCVSWFIDDFFNCNGKMQKKMKLSLEQLKDSYALVILSPSINILDFSQETQYPFNISYNIWGEQTNRKWNVNLYNRETKKRSKELYRDYCLQLKEDQKPFLLQLLWPRVDENHAYIFTAICFGILHSIKMSSA